MFWHSSSVILLNISTSNGPPRRLFSSFMNTVNPSQRRSAEKSQTMKNRNISQSMNLLKMSSPHHLGRYFPNNPNSDHLPWALDEFFVWNGSTNNCEDSNHNWLNDTQMKIHSGICLRNPIDWQLLSGNDGNDCINKWIETKLVMIALQFAKVGILL